MSDIEEKLRRYEKIDFLGEGQFATVYKAKDKDYDDRWYDFFPYNISLYGVADLQFSLTRSKSVVTKLASNKRDITLI